MVAVVWVGVPESIWKFVWPRSEETDSEKMTQVRLINRIVRRLAWFEVFGLNAFHNKMGN